MHRIISSTENMKRLMFFFLFSFSASGFAPLILEHPMNITVPQDEPVTLNCKATVGSNNQLGGFSIPTSNINNGQRPQLAIEWFKEGELVQTSSQGDPHAHRILLPDGSLFFLGAVRGRDDGVYWCVATNNHGFVRSRNATLHVACK